MLTVCLWIFWFIIFLVLSYLYFCPLDFSSNKTFLSPLSSLLFGYRNDANNLCLPPYPRAQCTYFSIGFWIFLWQVQKLQHFDTKSIFFLITSIEIPWQKRFPFNWMTCTIFQRKKINQLLFQPFVKKFFWEIFLDFSWQAQKCNISMPNPYFSSERP